MSPLPSGKNFGYESLGPFVSASPQQQVDSVHFVLGSLKLEIAVNQVLILLRSSRQDDSR